MIRRPMVVCLLMLCIWGCSGGGGGDDARSTATALRVIHAAVDVVPVVLIHNAQPIQSVKFNDSASYVPVPKGSSSISVKSGGTGDPILATFSDTLEDKTEYSVFLYGYGGDTVRRKLVVDNTSRPEKGTALVRFLNGYYSDKKASLVIDGDISLGSLPVGGVGDYIPVPMGPHRFAIKTASGDTLESGTIDLADMGEANIVISGAEELGVSFYSVFTDLD